MTECSRYIEWIGRRLDGSLSRDESAELERHLAACGRCRAEYALQRKIIAALTEEKPSRLPADFTSRVTARAMDIARARRRAERVGALVPVFALAGAAAALFIFRGQVAAALGPTMRLLGDSVAEPVSRLGSTLAGLLPAGSDMQIDSTPFVQRTLQSVIMLGGTAALMVAAAVWATRKAAELLRG